MEAKCFFCDNQPKSKCEGCKFAEYCGVECQRNDWNRHKTVCLIEGKRPREDAWDTQFEEELEETSNEYQDLAREMWNRFKIQYPDDGEIRWKIWKDFLNTYTIFDDEDEYDEERDVYELSPWDEEEDDGRYFTFKHGDYELELFLNIPQTMIVSAMKLNIKQRGLGRDEYGIPITHKTYPKKIALPSNVKSFMKIFGYSREGRFMVLNKINLFDDGTVKAVRTRIPNYFEMAYYLFKNGWTI